MDHYWVLPVIATANLALGFVLGKAHERWEWTHLFRSRKICVRRGP